MDRNGPNAKLGDRNQARYHGCDVMRVSPRPADRAIEKRSPDFQLQRDPGQCVDRTWPVGTRPPEGLTSWSHHHRWLRVPGSQPDRHPTPGY